MHFPRFYLLFFSFFLTSCLAMEIEKRCIDEEIKDLKIEDLNGYLKTIHMNEKIFFSQGFSLLHLAAQVGATEQAFQLINSKKYGVNDCDNEKGFTPLLIACRENDVVMVHQLLKCGANPNIASKKGTVPLINAVQKDNTLMVGILLFYDADVNQKDMVNDSTALHEAIGNGNSGLVTVLLDYHASPDLSLKHSFTPLMAAAQIESTSKDERTHCLRMVKALLDAKADLNIAHLEDGDTALHLAVNYSNKEVAYLLLKAGADANILNKRKETPLHFALYNIQNSFEESDKETKQHCDIARLLLLHGVQLSKEQLKNKNIDLNLILGAAINTGTNELVKFALEAGANPNHKNAFGDTPLLIIARGIYKKSQSAVIVSLLLTHGADPALLGADKRKAFDIFMYNQCMMNMRKKNGKVLNMIDALSECMKTQSNKRHRK